MIQVQTFLKNHLTKFNIGFGSGQTVFCSGYYAYYAGAKTLSTAQTFSAQRSFIDSWSYKGGNDARLDK